MVARSECDKCGCKIDYDEKSKKWIAKKVELNINTMKKGDAIKINGNDVEISGIKIDEKRDLREAEHSNLIAGQLIIEYIR